MKSMNYTIRTIEEGQRYTATFEDNSAYSWSFATLRLGDKAIYDKNTHLHVLHLPLDSIMFLMGMIDKRNRQTREEHPSTRYETLINGAQAKYYIDHNII
jgi:hypothetical protein